MWRRRVARSGEVRRGIRSQGVADRERARGAQRGRKGRPEPAIPATSAVRIAAARGRGPLRGRRGAGPESECVLVFPVHMTYRVVQATTTCHQAMANRRPSGPNESRRGQRGQHGDGKGRGKASGRSQTDATCPTCGGVPGLAGVSDAGAVVGTTGVIRRARQVTHPGQSRLARPNETASRTTTIHL